LLLRWLLLVRFGWRLGLGGILHAVAPVRAVRLGDVSVIQWIHLPDGERNAVAMLAIFAARMAFSNLEIR